MINKLVVNENMQKREEFIKSQEIQMIEVDKIILTEPIHIDAKVNFTKQIEKLKEKNITVLNNPIIVRKIENEYSLINGYKGYTIAKVLNHEVIPAIVIDEIRKDFTKRIGFKSSRFTEMALKDILIPKSFLERKVTRVKVQKVLDYYNKHKTFDKPVTIQGRRLLIDGYSRYVAAKILKLDKVPIVFA